MMKRWMGLLMLLLLPVACSRQDATNEATHDATWQYIFQSGTVLEFSGGWQLHEQFVPGIILFNNDVPMQIVEFPPDTYDEQVATIQENASVEMLDLNETLTVYYHSQQEGEKERASFLVVLPDRTSLGVLITAGGNLSDVLPSVHDMLATAHKPTYDQNIFAFDGRYMMLYPTDWDIDLNAGDAPFLITEQTIITVWSYSDDLLTHLYPDVDPNDLIQVTQTLVQLGVSIPPDAIDVTEIADHPVAIYRRPAGTSQGIVFTLEDYHFSFTFGSRTGDVLNPDDEAEIYAMIESLIVNSGTSDEKP